MTQIEQLDSYGQASSDFTQTRKNANQIQPGSKYVYSDQTFIDFSGIFSIIFGSFWIKSVLRF